MLEAMARAARAKLATYAILNDVHFPFENRHLYGIVLRILKRLKPEHVFLNGDIGEFLAVSTHSKHPADLRLLQEELAYLNKRLDELQALLPDTRFTLIEGNHCYRFFRYIRDVAPQMWGLIDCPQILKFPERPGWKFVPYGPTQLVRCGEANLWLRHEPLGGGACPAKQTAEKSVVDIAFGHTHIYQVHTHRKYGPSPFTVKAYSLGWLGDRSRHVFDYRGSKDNWAEGFSVVEADRESGEYVLDFIDLRKVPVLFRGKHYG